MKEKRSHRYFMSKRQMAGAILFGCLMAGIIVTGAGLHHVKTRQADGAEELQLMQERAEAIEARLSKQDRPRQQPFTKEAPKVHLHPFDPNTADSITLTEEGIPHWIARMMLNYRRKGGRYKQTEDLKKIPYMSDSLYAQIAPFVEIDSSGWACDTLKKQDRIASWQQKRDTILELNSCDTAQLKLLRGIGPYTALQIVNYRKRLGGYAAVEQLREVKGLQSASDTLLQHFVVCRDSIHPIRINHSSVERLQKHPYITFSQAKALYEYRRERYRLHDINDLRKLDTFTEEDLQRLVPYLSFEE